MEDHRRLNPPFVHVDRVGPAYLPALPDPRPPIDPTDRWLAHLRIAATRGDAARQTYLRALLERLGVML